MSRKIQNPNYTSPKKDRRTAKNVLTAITILILVIGIFLLLFVRCNSSQIPFKVGIKDNGAGQISNGILQSGDAEKIRAEFQKKVVAQDANADWDNINTAKAESEIAFAIIDGDKTSHWFKAEADQAAEKLFSVDSEGTEADNSKHRECSG